jgi:F0F1-type ATP synthase delta subunit
VIVDPSVVGGVVARVGDEIFDGSVRSRLIGAREQLTGTTTRSG